MERTLDARIVQAVEAWLRWLPTWRPATHRGRVRVCKRCFGSPVVRAAGLDRDVPHAVQHALSTRLTAVVDAAVEDYTAANLPLLARELRRAEDRAAGRYRPDEGLGPEYDGGPVDPEPVPGQPFLFTLGGLAESDPPPAASAIPPERELDEREREQLRREIQLADEHAASAGAAVCRALAADRPRIVAAVAAHVEPRIAELLQDLDAELDTPPAPW